ncbi:MAG TPA: polyprenyl synthetase family protein, partial [Bacillota bacterium]|nr:polyprenyl synthetase family protein [Bacillota bacterium]
MGFTAAYERKKNIINQKLEALLTKQNKCPALLVESVKYSLLAGGKRLRPILLLSSNELFEDNNQSAIYIAAAIEMIHTYS